MTGGRMEFDLRPESRRRAFVVVRTQDGDVEVPQVPSMTRAMARELNARLKERGPVSSSETVEEYLAMFLGREAVDGMTADEFARLTGLIVPKEAPSLGES